MADMPVLIRESNSMEGVASLRRALLAALTWREADALGPDIIESSGHGYLLEGWGRPGDTAVVAEVRGEAVGAAWYRSWTKAQHSYGFVGEEIPELGIGVERAWRGRGIGSELLLALFRLAAARGVKTLSLSVEEDNPAAGLYLRLGFQRLGKVGGAVTMVRAIGESAA